MSSADLAAMIGGFAAMFALGFAWGLSVLRKPKVVRARTCGTCSFCESGGMVGNTEGICAKRPYPVALEKSDHGYLYPTVRPVVRLEWAGCGESEEKR